MSDLIHQIRDAAARLHLTHAEIAVGAGVSIPTVIAAVRDGELPRTARCLRALAVFAERVTAAESRARLGLPS